MVCSAPKFYTSSKRPNASVGSLILGGRDFQKDFWITYQVSASRSYEVSSAGNPKADFSWNGPPLRRVSKKADLSILGNRAFTNTVR